MRHISLSSSNKHTHEVFSSLKITEHCTSHEFKKMVMHAGQEIQ